MPSYNSKWVIHITFRNGAHGYYTRDGEGKVRYVDDPNSAAKFDDMFSASVKCAVLESQYSSVDCCDATDYY